MLQTRKVTLIVFDFELSLGLKLYQGGVGGGIDGFPYIWSLISYETFIISYLAEMVTQ